MRAVPIPDTMHWEPGSCKNGHPACMGAIHGDGRRYPLYTWNEGALPATKANDRKDLWDSQGESWVPIYPTVRKSPDEDEGRAYICMYEPKETGKDPESEGAVAFRNDRKEFFLYHTFWALTKKKKSRAMPVGINTTLSSV